MLIHDFNTRKAVSEENKLILLSHIRESGFVTAELASNLLRKSLSCAYKLLNKFEAKGLLRKHFCSELRVSLWGLTDYGILISWDKEETTKPRVAFQPSKISPIMVMHEIQLQQTKIQALRVDGWKDWVFGAHISGKLEKRPDALVTSPDGLRFACEVERFSKSRKRLSTIISIFLRAIKRGDYDYIAYIAPDEDLAFRLKKLFRSITHVPVSGQRVQLTEKHYEKFLFYSLESWPKQKI